MKLGLLNAVSPKPDSFSGLTEPEKFQRLFAAVDASFEYKLFEVTEGALPASIDEADAYLVTGSIKGVYDDDPWIGQLGAFIRRAFGSGKKLVGICFGHQIIAHSLGGRAEKSAKGWGAGRKTFNLQARKPWLTPWQGDLALYFLHQDQVTALPAGGERLAGNGFCPNVMYAIGDQVLGIQGHPEYSPDLMHALLKYLRDENGLPFKEVLEQYDFAEPDSRLVARWIVNFLQI
jgi:GMP synthase-like glutamine amidotransferase